MYKLSDRQVEYILSDIKSRGIEIEDLQHNLLDHICCLIESELIEDEDFQGFYNKVVPRFFKKDLKEIEEETINLLTFKNYYAMKKTMITTGVISVSAFIIGSIFKVMHWPGAGPLLVLGIGILSLVFLPLMFILKTKDKSSTQEKLILAVGSLVGILLCMAVLFTIMHWPAGNGILWLSAIGISVFVLIPIYFFTGIRNPDTKMNTIVTSIILVGASGLLFAMINVRPSSKLLHVKMYNYVQSEELLRNMQARVNGPNETNSEINDLAVEINNNCEQIKKLIIVNALGDSTIPKDFDKKEILMEEGNLGDHFFETGRGLILFNELKEKVKRYNARVDERNKIPFNYSLLNIESDKIGRYNNYAVLDGITKLQMYLYK